MWVRQYFDPAHEMAELTVIPFGKFHFLCHVVIYTYIYYRQQIGFAPLSSVIGFMAGI
jgi:hypothetical protein